MKKLNLGCGFDYKEGWVNLECNRSVKADVYHDLEKKLPFEDNSFDEVFAGQVIEHIYNVEQLFEEIYRVLKPDGVLLFSVPYANCVKSYSTRHKSFFTPFSFDHMFKEVQDKKGLRRFDIYGGVPKMVFKKEYMKLRVMFFHFYLPESFKYLSIFLNIFIGIKAKFRAIK